MSTLTIINSRRKSITVAGNLTDGRYLLDKGCEQADLHHVVRTLCEDEDAYDVWDNQRSDDAMVIEVSGYAGRILA